MSKENKIIYGGISLEQAKWLHDESFKQGKRKIQIIRDLIDAAMKVE